jgi:hypothetical protein
MRDMGEVDGRRMHAIAVEVWSEFVVVRWSLQSGLALGDADRGLRGWSLNDDVGTAYVAHSVGGGGNDGHMRYEAEWRPASPPDARQLDLAYRDSDGQERLRETLDLL